MREIVMQILDTAHAFVVTHPILTAYVVIAIITIALRIAGSTWWAGVKARRPAIAGLLEVARGLGFDAPKILQGLLRIAYAMLPPPVGGGGGAGAAGSKPSSSSTSGLHRAIHPRAFGPNLVMGLLAATMLLGGCSWWNRQGPAVVTNVGDMVGCVLSHVGEDPKSVAKLCGVEEVGTVISIFSAHKAAMQREAAHAAAAASGSAR